jgi:hypothetical protein
MIREIAWGEFRKSILWIESYYDGPLSGVARLDGKPVWFELQALSRDCDDPTCGTVDDPDDEEAYDIFALGDEAWALLCERHEDFRTWVGEHWDCQEGERDISRSKPQELWHLYYDKWGKDGIPRVEKGEKIAVARCKVKGEDKP